MSSILTNPRVIAAFRAETAAANTAAALRLAADVIEREGLDRDEVVRDAVARLRSTAHEYDAESDRQIDVAASLGATCEDHGAWLDAQDRESPRLSTLTAQPACG